MIKKYFTLLSIGFLTLFSACETEFSLNGDYEPTPVIFGLLDHTDSVHMVKITKAFLGDGDNLVYAKTPDSNYFEQVEARIIEYKDGGATGREWTLTDSIINTKSTDGIFYGPEQKVYVFYANDLDPANEYELIGDVNEGQHSFSARTSLLNGFDVQNNVKLDSYEIRFAPNTVSEDEDYEIWRVQITEALNGARYELSYTFRWTEEYEDGSVKEYEANNKGETYLQDSPSTPSVIQGIFAGLDFYRFVGETLNDDPDVVRRKFVGFDLKIAAAHFDLNQYMEVSTPSTSISQVKPTYTNIDGGYGLFSARQLFEIKNMQFSPATMKELCRGSYTVTKKFCSQLTEHLGESFHCP